MPSCPAALIADNAALRRGEDIASGVVRPYSAANPSPPPPYSADVAAPPPPSDTSEEVQRVTSPEDRPPPCRTQIVVTTVVGKEPQATRLTASGMVRTYVPPNVQPRAKSRNSRFLAGHHSFHPHDERALLRVQLGETSPILKLDLPRVPMVIVPTHGLGYLKNKPGKLVLMNIGL